MAAVAPILDGHPTALLVGQLITAVVAVISFYFAYKVTKPLTHRSPQAKRQNKVEVAVGLASICNPGRRSSDRCSACPMDETCIKKLPPLGAAERARDQATVRANARLPRESSVVFVDDNAALREVVEVLLNDAGLSIRVARDVASAVPFLEHERLLVTDWRLADGTGGEVIRAFRESQADRAVIIVSALEHPPKDAPKDIRWVSKPFDPDDLVAMVSKALKSVPPDSLPK